MGTDRHLFAALFAVIAFGIPAVATYYPLQTYAVLEVIESLGSQTAAIAESQNPPVQAEIESVSSTTPTVMPGLTEEDRNLFPPRPI